MQLLRLRARPEILAFPGLDSGMLISDGFGFGYIGTAGGTAIGIAAAAILGGLMYLGSGSRMEKAAASR
ncbi:Uncharacterised protein [uncultured archaeon]|nr:Uncharacterised protein [uncultured archaeon]